MFYKNFLREALAQFFIGGASQNVCNGLHWTISVVRRATVQVITMPPRTGHAVHNCRMEKM